MNSTNQCIRYICAYAVEKRGWRRVFELSEIYLLLFSNRERIEISRAVEFLEQRVFGRQSSQEVVIIKRRKEARKRLKRTVKPFPL